MTILVTGAAGFIGFHTVKRLCADGHQVIGIDNLNSYYSVELKRARLAQLDACSNFQFRWLDVADNQALRELFAEQPFEQVIHLAAQAGVRYSIDNPDTYAQSNLVGFLNILEACRLQKRASLGRRHQIGTAAVFRPRQRVVRIAVRSQSVLS